MKGISKTALAAAIALGVGSAAQAQQQSESERGAAQGAERGAQQSQSRGAASDRYSASRYQAFESSEHGQRAAEKMSEMDRNRDERIDQTEAQGDPQLIAAWAEVDVTRDGSLDATEYYLYAAQSRIAELEQGRSGQQASAGQQGQQQDRQSQQGQPGQPGQQGGAQVDFDEADANGDGQLSRTEYQAALRDGSRRSRESGG